MYAKSFFISALLAASATATSHEVAPVAGLTPPPPPPPPAGHQGAPPPPAGHQVPPPPPAAQVHKNMAPPPPPAGHVPPPPPPPAGHVPPVMNGHNAAPPPPPPGHQVAPNKGAVGGMMHQALTVHLVSVGDNNGSLKYFPDTVHAMPGDVVQFQFHPKNHTVTESTFDEPCKAKDPSLATAQRPGLKSGFIPVTGSETTTPVYNVLVNDTMPIWIFCGQMPHCAKGMSMVINPPADPARQIAQYQAKAATLAPPPGAAPPGAPPAAGAPPTPPPAGASPPVGGASPPPPPPAAGGAAAPPEPPAAGASAVGAAAAGSSTNPAPATFTGAASKTTFGSFGVFALALVALL